MRHVSNLKQWLVIMGLSVLTACSSTPTTVDTAATDPASSDKLYSSPSSPSSKSVWHKAYGKPQEASPNKLSEQTSVEPVADVWQRVRNGMELTPYRAQEAETKKYLSWFVDHPEYVDKVVERARPYLHHIVSELEKRNMPLEIALLPVVESGYQPFAYSKSRAAGLWQFIPSTGKVYGLKQDWWYDGRRDVIASTSAALTYLQKLHNDFGDWQLALAAYNCGEGTVGRAIKRNKKAGKPTDFWSLDLPKETSAYVPKLMAVSHLVAMPERYDIKLSPIENKPFLTVVDTESQLDLAVAAKLAGITADELHLLNPGFNHWATLPGGPHRLVLPLDKAAQFKQALSTLPKEDRMRWVRHKIKKGESLGLIAKRHSTTVEALKETNNLTSNTIRAGRHLLIPMVGEVSPQYSQMAKKRAKIANKAKKKIHVVKAGDTWWDLANTYNVSVTELTGWNNKSPRDTLNLKQKLVVWPQKTKHGQSDKVKVVSYKIRSGDSLWKISRKFNVSVAQVREWNGLSSRTLLRPGQMLTLYVEKS